MLPEITNRLKTIQAITVSHALNWQIYKKNALLLVYSARNVCNNKI